LILSQSNDTLLLIILLVDPVYMLGNC